MTRGERIVCLVWSMGDAVATPGGSRELRRVAATREVACEPCGGTGRALDRFRRPVLCPDCAGNGRFWVDGYTGERTGAPGSVAPAEDLVSFRRRVGCSWCQEPDRARWDAERGTWLPVGRRLEVLPRGTGVRAGRRCEPCDGTGWRWVSADLEVPGVGRDTAQERVAWRIAGSYGELARALAALRHESVAAYRALVGEAASGRWPLEADWSVYGLGAVERRMPALIVVSGDVLVAWKDRERRAGLIRGPRRDQTIRELAAAGVSIGELAGRSGLSDRQVRRIAYGERSA